MTRKREDTGTPEVPASITVTETVVLKAANMKTESLGYGSYTTFDSLTVADIEEFVRIARRELDPAAIKVRPGEGTLTATQSTKTDR